MLLVVLIVFGVILVTVFLQKIRDQGDLAALMLAFMVIITQLLLLSCVNRSSLLSTPRTEAFAQPQSLSGYDKFDGNEDISEFPVGLVYYLSCYSDASYPDDGGKAWNNAVAVKNKKKKADVDGREKNFSFVSTPAFSREHGFVMRTNSLSGPYSVDMGIRGDMPYTVFFLAGGAHVYREYEGNGNVTNEGEGDIVVFRLYANTMGMNGISVVMEPSGEGREEEQSRDGTTRLSRMRMWLLIGDRLRLECTTDEPGGDGLMTVDSSHRYLFVIVKDYGTVKVIMYDIDKSDDSGAVTLVQSPLVSQAPVHFSNKDASINETRNWNANLSAFGIYDRAISDRESLRLSDHYREIHRRFDPTYLKLMEEIRKREEARACPFDPRTCSMCHAVKDWTDFQSIVTSSDDCRASIARFCVDNPSHERCGCWSVNHPHYKTSCKEYRCAIGGSKAQPECKAAASPPIKLPPPPPPTPSVSSNDIRKAVSDALRQQRDAERKEEEEERRRNLAMTMPTATGVQQLPGGQHDTDDNNNDQSKSFWDWLVGN
jgi:hypothetical protein